MFKKKKNTAKESSTLSTRLAQAIVGLQMRWTRFMERKSRNWGRRQKITFLGVVSLVFLTAIIHILVGVITGRSTIKPYAPSAMPILVLPPPAEPAARELGPDDTLAIREFRQAVDSLLQTPEGRKVYQDFIQQRPGFLDSVAFLEQQLKEPF